MSVPLPSPRLPHSPGKIAAHSAPTIGTVPTTHNPARPLDLLMITSCIDFKESTDRLSEEASQAGLTADTLFIEDLDGDSAAEKLAHLRKVIGSYRDQGRLQPSTITSITLHGGLLTVNDTPAYGVDEPIVAHCFSTTDKLLKFPSILVCQAIRNLGSGDDPAQATYTGPLFIMSCYAGGMPEQFLPESGEVILLSGKKASLITNGNDCLLQAVALIAEHKQRGLPPPSGREYWSHLRNVSGEHIRYANSNEIALHKVRDWNPSEPLLRCRTGDIEPTAVRIINAKLAHGSPAALKAALDTHGTGCRDLLTPEFCLQILGSDLDRDGAALAEKIRVLEQAGFVALSDPEQMALLLEYAIEAGNQRLLAWMLGRSTDAGPRPSALLEAASILVKTAPDSAALLEEYCAKNAGLKSIVVDWMTEHIAASKAVAPSQRLDCEAIPRLALWLCERQLGCLPPLIGRLLSARLRMPKKPKHKKEIIRTLIWGGPMDIWNCAMHMAIARPTNLTEAQQIRAYLSWALALDAKQNAAGRAAPAAATPSADSDDSS